MSSVVPDRTTPVSSVASAISTLEQVRREADQEVTEAREALTRAILKRARADVGLASLGIQLEQGVA